MMKSTAKLTLPAALARSILFLASGSALLLAQQASAQTPTVTYRVAVESNAGQDGGIAWQSAYLLKDGRIASFGTGNHVANQSNAMRIIDPVGTPGSVRAYDLFPWTQDVSPPNLSGGQNRYVSNYDNHASIYIPSDNKAIWVNHGVFDFNSGTWTYGDRAPLSQGYRSFLDDSAVSMEGAFNPAVAWCSQIDKGVWFGNSDGGYGQDFDVLTVVERSAAGAAKPGLDDVAQYRRVHRRQSLRRRPEAGRRRHRLLQDQRPDQDPHCDAGIVAVRRRLLPADGLRLGAQSHRSAGHEDLRLRHRREFLDRCDAERLAGLSLAHGRLSPDAQCDLLPRHAGQPGHEQVLRLEQDHLRPGAAATEPADQRAGGVRSRKA
jgi:hypothetical protein